MKVNHKQIAEDYKKLCKMYNHPFDLTGGLVVEEVLMAAVLKGTKTACTKAILTIIDYGFEASDNKVYRYEAPSEFLGYKEVSIYECDFIKYISDTYL